MSSTPGPTPEPSGAHRWAPAPLEMRLLARTLLHAGVLGALAGAVGAAFFAALELAQRLLLEGLAGYAPARAVGETFLPASGESPLRPFVLALLPALGALASGLLTSRFAPEAAGGGGDATVESYHHGGVVRRRLLVVKPLAALLTLATGGSGGREGPTMQIGGALGALAGRLLPTSPRERRTLMVAGVAAGIAAVFRTPLGAALLACEMLYRDDLEAEALVPAVLASVVAYAVVISIYGETTLFGRLQPFRFVPAHLPLYLLLALVTAYGAVLFLVALRAVQRLARRVPGPAWVAPALGGLAMGLLGVAFALVMAHELGPQGARVGLFGGGYGVAQVALSGRAGLPAGWGLVALLGALFLAKLAASALTIGSGAAAGDFAPSVVLGGLLGSLFGHACALVLHDPRLDPTAFALVGMGTFYGGVAHAPLSALVLVAELAGSYDLLVPMMFAIAIAFVVLRHWSLYPAQPVARSDSPLLRAGATPVGAPPAEEPAPVEPRTVGACALPPELAPVLARATVAEVLQRAAEVRRQKVAVVVDDAGAPRGLVDLTALRALSRQDLAWALAADAMIAFTALPADAPPALARLRLAETGLAQLPVVEGEQVVGYVSEAELGEP